MANVSHILKIAVLLLLFLGYCSGRVIYIMAHAEKPDDEDNEELKRYSSMDGLGAPEDGLGVTGMLRTSYMIDTFGRNAPFYRQPKRIITQHFVTQNNGNFINNGHRGHHTSRRMYHQTYALALNLGIDPDEEKCCGGSFIDVLSYIFTLPPEDDPVLIVTQHGTRDLIVSAYSYSYGGPGYYDLEKKFGKKNNYTKDPHKIWTLIDGDLVEEWYMCTPLIPGSLCTDLNELHKKKPSWVDKYNFPQTAAKAPIVPTFQYPSYIYTPDNIGSKYHWSYRAELRKRGINFGEECINDDIVKVKPGNITVV